MPERPAPPHGLNAHHQERFDGRAVRRILQLAVEEQHRRESALADSYSIEELEEMAAEARISPEALRAAVDAQRRETAAAGGAEGGRRAPERPRGWRATMERWRPQRWSPRATRLALNGGGVAALSGVLLLLAVMAPTAFWVTSLSLITLSLLVLLGASPF